MNFQLIIDVDRRQQFKYIMRKISNGIVGVWWEGGENEKMKKLVKKPKKNTVIAFSCTCHTCSGCSKWGTSGGAATSTGTPK